MCPSDSRGLGISKRTKKTATDHQKTEITRIFFFFWLQLLPRTYVCLQPHKIFTQIAMGVFLWYKNLVADVLCGGGHWIWFLWDCGLDQEPGTYPFQYFMRKKQPTSLLFPVSFSIQNFRHRESLTRKTTMIRYTTFFYHESFRQDYGPKSQVSETWALLCISRPNTSGTGILWGISPLWLP